MSVDLKKYMTCRTWKHRYEAGMMKWETIKSGYKTKDAYVLVVSKGQFLYFPFSIFNSDHDLKLMERILKQKELLKDEKPTK